MAFDQGIDFRNTSGFVTDPTNCTFEIGTTANYPRTSAQGNTVGWEDALGANTRNRSAAVDARLAGIAFTANGTSKRYRIDLPSSGWYRITVALGDQSSAQTQSATVSDNTTPVSHICSNAATSAAQFIDACGLLRTTVADWTSNEVSFVAFFSSTICRITIGDSGASGNSTIAHFRVTDASPVSPRVNSGLDFRLTPQFVTDPTNCDVVNNLLNFADYPHITASGLTIGWEQAPSVSRNRSAAVDARLAGLVAVTGPSKQSTFRIDLPAAGSYRIAAAIGDNSTGQGAGSQTVELVDDTSSLGFIVNAGSTLAGQFIDATGTTRTSAADWVSNQQQITATFATTTLRIKCNRTAYAGTDSTTLAHFQFTQLFGITGTSSLSALINRFRKIVASIAGTASLAATVSATKVISATVAGTSSLAATISGLHRTITATVSGTSSLTATVTTGGPKIFTAAIHGTSSLRAVTPYILHASGEITVDAADVIYTPLSALSAAIVLRADSPRSAGPYAPTSGVLLLRGDSAKQPSLFIPGPGIIRLVAPTPRIGGPVIPNTGQIRLAADTPTIIPWSTTAGVIGVKATPPSGVPTATVAARIILVGGPPTVYPVQVNSSGVLVLRGDAPIVEHVGYILNQSGIIRLRSDVPVVTPLTEPPPPPPPPPPGTGLAISGVE